jgi:hypothetical protein
VVQRDALRRRGIATHTRSPRAERRAGPQGLETAQLRCCCRARRSPRTAKGRRGRSSLPVPPQAAPPDPPGCAQCSPWGPGAPAQRGGPPSRSS